jgi:SpoVK/Ycf46/Vps4 family AAA+-type ATPase
MPLEAPKKKAPEWPLVRDGEAVRIDPNKVDAFAGGLTLKTVSGELDADQILEIVARKWPAKADGTKWTVPELKAHFERSPVTKVAKTAAQLGLDEDTVKAFLNRHTWKPAKKVNLDGAEPVKPILPPPMQSKSLEELDELVGLQDVKDKVRSIVDYLLIEQAGELFDIEADRPPLHMVMTGKPGTGKSTVANIMANFLGEVGYLEKGHVVKASGSDLVAGNAGSAAEKTRAKLEEALGGVFFLDEAYALEQAGGMGRAAVNELVDFMEAHKHELVVIMAGYDKEMDKLIASNRGLRRRIRWTLPFKDYSDDELGKIAEKMAGDRGRKIGRKALAALTEQLGRKRSERDFGNAGAVETAVDEALRRQATRLAPKLREGEAVNLEDLAWLTSEDLIGPKPPDADDAIKSLDDLVGLDTVKAKLKEFASMVEWAKKRGKNPWDAIEPTFVFTGDPGTGKTTVARLLAKTFREMGFLPTENLVELSVGKILQPYLGQTAHYLAETMDTALGGVLFIDEAYLLAGGGYGGNRNNPYADEAIGEMITHIENNRGKYVVVFAGYKDPMKGFLNANEGMLRRVPHVVEFDNMDAKGALELFERYAAKEDLKLSDGAQKALPKAMAALIDMPAWANGGDVRNFFNEVMRRTAVRIITGGEDGPLDVVEAVDLQSAVAAMAEKKAMAAGARGNLGARGGEIGANAGRDAKRAKVPMGEAAAAPPPK